MCPNIIKIKRLIKKSEYFIYLDRQYIRPKITVIFMNKFDYKVSTPVRFFDRNINHQTRALNLINTRSIINIFRSIELSRSTEG